LPNYGGGVDSTVGMGSIFHFYNTNENGRLIETTNTFEAANIQSKKCLIMYNHTAGREALMQNMKAF